MSALVNVLTILDKYALKQISKKHENSIKYSKTRGLEQWQIRRDTSGKAVSRTVPPRTRTVADQKKGRESVEDSRY